MIYKTSSWRRQSEPPQGSPFSDASSKSLTKSWRFSALVEAGDSAVSVLPVTLWVAVLFFLNHGANAGSGLDTANCDYRRESSLATVLSHCGKERVEGRYDRRFFQAHRPEYHDWIGHLHLRHPVVQLSNISRTPLIFGFQRRRAHGVCELRQDLFHWPSDLSQHNLQKIFFAWKDTSVVGT